MKVLSRIGWFGRQSLGLAGNLAMNPVSTLRAAKLAWKNGAGRTAGNFLSDANLLARSLAVGPSPMMAMDTSALKGELKPFSVEESVVDAGRERKFVVTNDKGEILAPRTDVADALNLKLISVSSDQKTYWPNEKVNLAILLPGRPNAEVEVTLTKKDGAPVELGKHTVDENGVLSLVVMNGEEDPLGLGEYTINVKTVDKTISAEAVISVVEGTLGALSFGHTWAELKGDEEELPPGYWYLVGRRGGRAGDRWGHGMNVGNIIMDEGKPYNGEVTINVRCYLPQCNGVEAAPAQKVNIEDGVLKTVLNTDYHSGPFEIEIITEKGSIRHLFGQSGHVERNMVNISEGLGNQFRAGISPYEGTTAVDGRSVYYEKAETEDAALLLESPVADASSRTRLVAQSVIEDLKIFVHIPNPDGTFKVQELSDLPKTVQKGEVIEVPVVGPYSTIVVAGNKVAGKDKKFFEGYSLVFTPGQLAVQIDAPSQSSPMAEVALGVRTINPITGAPLTSSGILTVFDTRVESPEATGPLTSALGRSFRDGAETLGELEDTLGFGRYMNEDLMDFDDDDGGMEVFGLTGGSDRSLGGYGIRDSGVRHFSGGGGPVLRRMAFLSAGAPTLGGGYAGRGGDFDSEEIPAEEGELREGTQKVVYSERISTGPDGFVKIKIALGPQTGRYRAAFSAVKGTEFAKGSAQVDATLPASVEAPLPKFLVDGARVEARVIVNNSTGGEVTLRITGAGLMAPVIKKLSGEREEVPVTLISGRPDDKLLMEIIGADQKVIDSRQLTIGNVSNQKATTSRLVISDGDTPVSVAPGERAAVFRNVGQMLSGILRNMITTTESWFPHAETVTADAAVKAQLL
ncbi:MAG: hypothetical protein HQ564_02925, partial [Candidatus Saganbacteria bacterium]|nr:hypothetical protein [Candidatus Saganbacteria bacterium]